MTVYALGADVVVPLGDGLGYIAGVDVAVGIDGFIIYRPVRTATTRHCTASGSGTGTSTATRSITRRRTATGAGTGTSTAHAICTRRRTATGTGLGTATATRSITRRRTAAGSGLGTSSATGRVVIPPQIGSVTGGIADIGDASSTIRVRHSATAGIASVGTATKELLPS